jgi:hypothetical protein
MLAQQSEIPIKEEDETIVRCSSLFSQLIAIFNRKQFYRLVINHKSERYSKGVNSWDHFVAMFFVN